MGISQTMKKAIEIAKSGGGRLARSPGGFWRSVSNGESVGGATINALIARGLVRVVETKKFSRAHWSGMKEFPVLVEITEKAKEV